MYMFSWCSTYEPVERNFVHMCTLCVQLNDNKIATYLPTYLPNHRGSKGLIKDGSKQTSKLIGAGPQNAASNPIRSGCFPDVHSPQFPPNLILRYGGYMIADLSAAS